MDAKTTYTYLSSSDNQPYRRTTIRFPDGSGTGLLEKAETGGKFTKYKGEGWRITEQASVISKEEFDKLVKEKE